VKTPNPGTSKSSVFINEIMLLQFIAKVTYLFFLLHLQLIYYTRLMIRLYRLVSKDGCIVVKHIIVVSMGLAGMITLCEGTLLPCEQLVIFL
jgi:hypothetical protein